MKLDQLLKKITPLPYRLSPNKRAVNKQQAGPDYQVAYCGDSNDTAYLVHAANVLPELVEALCKISDRYKGNHTTGNIARAALARAEEVKTE